MNQVLILDDDELFGRMLADRLEKQRDLNLNVTTTTTLEQAKETTAKTPGLFDIFLIDERLGPGPDGIDAIPVLRRHHPDADVIIFTGADDAESGFRAYQAGAYRYLAKPFQPSVLIWTLTTLLERRHAQYERDWLRILSDLAERTQRALSLSELGMQLTKGCQSLGFERVRFWLRNRNGEVFQCESQADMKQLKPAKTQSMLVSESPYVQQIVISRKPVIFIGEEFGPSFLARKLGKDFQTPRGEWAGVPLWIGNQCQGFLTLDNTQTAITLRSEQKSLLELLGRYAAAALERMQLFEQEKRAKAQLAILHQASQVIMELAEENEEWLWHATLTVATSVYGLAFNRAIVFTVDESLSQLRGLLGIGHYDTGQARFDWERDEQNELTFTTYLQQLRDGIIRRTPLERRAGGYTFSLTKLKGEDLDSLQQGKRQIVFPDQPCPWLPEPFVERFGETEFAILPLRAAGRLIGLAFTDNVHNREPLSSSALDYLEPLLAQATLIHQNVRERQIRDHLLELGYEVIVRASSRALQATLKEICSVTLPSTSADRVIIFPLKNIGEPLEFNASALSWASNDPGIPGPKIPRPDGLTSHIIRTGKLIVPDIQKCETVVKGNSLTKHPHLKAEGINAFIGVSILHPTTKEPLGVLYLDYKTPRYFNDNDVHHAELFASLAAVAIHDFRSAEGTHADLAKAESKVEIRTKELEILSKVLMEALNDDLNEAKIIRALLQAAKELIGQPDVAIWLMLREWIPSASNAGEPREIRRQYCLNGEDEIVTTEEKDVYRGISGKVFREGESCLVADVTQEPWKQLFYAGSKLAQTRSELDLPIKSGERIIGVLNVESSKPAAFDRSNEEACQRLAYAASLALGNLRRQQNLRAVLAASQAITAPLNLDETLESITTAVQNATPDLSTMTIWYKEVSSDNVKLVNHFGVRHVANLEETHYASQDSVVWEVMRREEPIWAPTLANQPFLAGEFSRREACQSVAAFPLRSDDEIVGAMFLSYRQFHDFSREEKDLLSVLAEVVSASVRDAAHLEAVRRERERLQAAQDIAEAVGTTLSVEETLRKIMNQLVTLFSGVTPCVLTYDEGKEELEFSPTSLQFYPLGGSAYPDLRRLSIHEASLAGTVALTSLQSKQVEVLNVPDVTEHPKYLDIISQTHSQLSLSLMSEEELLGVFVLESTRANAFSNVDITLIKSVGHQISVALARARESQQLRFKTTVAATTAWAAEIAHEINHAVGRIRNRAYWIKEKFQLGQDVHGWAEEIDESAHSLIGTVSSTERSSRAAIEIDLDGQLRQWITEVAQKHRARLVPQFELACNDIKVKVHALALKRIVRHLIYNALDAMENCEPNLVVRTRIRDKDYIEVQIQDSGSGINESLRQTIFQEPVSTKTGEVRGFGLLFARSMIEDMGGKIWVLPDRVHSGTTICFTLPVKPPEEK